VAWYFIWPTSRGETDTWGFVSEKEFFEFCQKMERVPIRTAWPHESHLYRQLSGKLWVPQMCLNKEFRLPPTTRVHYTNFCHSARKAAVGALEALMRLRTAVWGKEPVPMHKFRGVAKLGFSWGGLDVLPFRGVHSLASCLKTLFGRQDSDSTVCLVQEMIEGVVGELRILCFRDQEFGIFRREAVWIVSCRALAGPKHTRSASAGDAIGGDFTLASASAAPPADVTNRFFKGDRAAQHAAEREADQLVDGWLRWFQTESPEPPQVTRIDFLVAHPSAGQADVWTCEVGECGASLCTVEVHGRNAASLNNAMLRDDSGRFPARLPSTLPRNSGWKS